MEVFNSQQLRRNSAKARRDSVERASIMAGMEAAELPTPTWTRHVISWVD